MPTKPRLTLLLLFLAASASPALAQDAVGKTVAQQNQFILEPGGIELSELINRSARFLGWNILVNELELQNSSFGGQTINLQNRVVADIEDCEDLLTTMLATKGFGVRVLNEGKHLYQVIAMNGPFVRELFSLPPQKTPAQILSRSNLRMPVATVVQLEHINAVVATNALRQFFAQNTAPNNSISVGNVGSAGSVVISGMQDKVANAICILREADLPQPVGQTMELQQEVKSLEKRVAKLEKALAERNKEK